MTKKQINIAWIDDKVHTDESMRRSIVDYFTRDYVLYVNEEIEFSIYLYDSIKEMLSEHEDDCPIHIVLLDNDFKDLDISDMDIQLEELANLGVDDFIGYLLALNERDEVPYLDQTPILLYTGKSASDDMEFRDKCIRLGASGVFFKQSATSDDTMMLEVVRLFDQKHTGAVNG